MNFDGNFRRVGDVNIDAAKAYASKLSEESWFQDVSDVRDAEDEEGSQVIYLVHDDGLRHDQPTRRPALEVFGAVIRPILAVIADHYDSSPEGQRLTQKNGAGYFVRARLLRVRAGASLQAGEDVVFSETHAHRIHLPVIAEEPLGFSIDKETLSIPEGEIFEINNRRKSVIENNSSNACVHLVLDYVLKGEMCCCGKTHHPQEPCGPESCYATDRDPGRCDCF